MAYAAACAGENVRRKNSVGPSTLSVIDDARVDLALALLSLREGDTEPNIALPGLPSELDDQDQINSLRRSLMDALSPFDHDELQPLEQRCRRVCRLADGKGPSSLEMIADRQFDDGRRQEFMSQPDRLCRSIWAYLNERDAFEDAESFHFARQFREHGRLYDAFEVDLGAPVTLDAASIDAAVLADRVTKTLKLKTACTVKAIDLPATAAHPASIMIIVRHGGPLSSVHDHKNDGRRGTIYYRPPNEATLIYTPSMRQIEVCADSPVVRQTVSDSFAEVALGHDVSQKPLTWKHYNLLRFRSSLRLEPPIVDGYEIKFARVLEAEVRLGAWRRKLLLKVTVDDDIEEVADQYLGARNVFRRAEALSRIGVAVAYNRVGDERERTLNITISGTQRCNLQSNKDPDERSLGFALLKEWGILSAFRQIDADDLRSMFIQLLKLHDRADDEVGGAYLHELGLDPYRLVQGGLLQRRDRQDVVLIEDDELDGEGDVKPSATRGMVRLMGPFGEDAGKRPAFHFDKYSINAQWLHETLLQLMKPLLSKRAPQILDADLTLLGRMQINGAEVPVYFGRRLDDHKIAARLDLLLRARNNEGVGIVLAASAEMPGCLGPNVVVPLLSNMSAKDEEFVLSRDGLELAYRNSFLLASGGSTPQVVRSGDQSGTLYVPGKDPLHLGGNDQLTIFERLVAARRKGSPDVQVKDLMEGFVSRSPQQVFEKVMWKSILDVYISKGAKRGYWRLVVARSSTVAPI